MLARTYLHREPEKQGRKRRGKDRVRPLNKDSISGRGENKLAGFEPTISVHSHGRSSDVSGDVEIRDPQILQRMKQDQAVN